MKALSVIHRWAGGFLGLLLAILGLSGAILVWEGEWIALPGANDPVVENAVTMGAIADAAAKRGELLRITFASDEIGLHQLAFADGQGAYVAQDGRVVDAWAGQWDRPELWLFDLHHNLFAGHTGETAAGIAGIAGVLFVITGVVLWSRSRRSFAPRLWPKRFAVGPIVSHHRDLGTIAAPLLLLSLVTGSLMLFEPLRAAFLGAEVRPKTNIAAPAGSPSVAAMLEAAKARFPNAELRRISFPREDGDPILVRMRQPFEWTPNGRTQLTFDAATGRLRSIEDAARANGAAAAAEKLYPLHSAKAGGLVMKLAMTLSGLALFLLGSLATWSFWVRKARKRRSRASRPLVSAPASS